MYQYTMTNYVCKSNTKNKYTKINTKNTLKNTKNQSKGILKLFKEQLIHQLLVFSFQQYRMKETSLKMSHIIWFGLNYVAFGIDKIIQLDNRLVFSPS